MNKKLLGLISILAIVGLVAAAAVFQYNQTAHVTATVAFDFYLDDVITPPDTTIDWGDLEPLHTYEKLMNVTNTGNVPIIITAIISDLPSGWTETWAGNETLLLVGERISAPLILTVPLSDTSASYNWMLTLEAIASEP